jgi:hypothetical protein
MRDSSHGSDADARSRQTREDVSVYRVTDYVSSDLLSALELCNQMIPVQERQGTPEEILQQLRSAQDRRAQGTCPFQDYHFVAKLASAVCGYAQLFFYPGEKFAFVGFFVVRAGLSLGKQMAWVTSRMCQEIIRQLALDHEFGACERMFLELDDPARAADEKQRRRGMRRVTRFEAIAQQCGRELRLLDFDYLQACLGLPADGSGPERPHLLGYVSKGAEACLDGETVRNVLRLIYTRLNPEGVYDGKAEQDGLYRSYLQELCTRESARVPASVRLLAAHEIVARAPCPRSNFRTRGM